MTVHDLRAELGDSREQLLASITGLAEEQFRYTPGEAAWNVATHLAHLLRIERVYAARGAVALREDEPSVKSTSVANDDDPAVAQHLAVPQMIHGLQASRRDIEALLESGAAALARTIMHERLGRMTLEQIVRKMADHEREHTIAIAALARQAQGARRVTIPLTARS